MPFVDLVDNVQVTRQQIFEEVDRPALQGFRQDGVIGVGTGTDHDVPGLDKQDKTRNRALSHILTCISAELQNGNCDYQIKICIFWQIQKIQNCRNYVMCKKSVMEFFHFMDKCMTCLFGLSTVFGEDFPVSASSFANILCKTALTCVILLRSHAAVLLWLLWWGVCKVTQLLHKWPQGSLDKLQ